MSIIRDEDCIRRADGSLVCWDRDECCYLIINKQKATEADLSKDELSALVKLMGKPREEVIA